MNRVTERVRKHRENRRKAGFHPIQLWVPDTRNPRFQAECRRQSRLLQTDPNEEKTLDWIEQAADLDGWT